MPKKPISTHECQTKADFLTATVRFHAGIKEHRQICGTCAAQELVTNAMKLVLPDVNFDAREANHFVQYIAQLNEEMIVNRLRSRGEITGLALRLDHHHDVVGEVIGTRTRPAVTIGKRISGTWR